MADEDPMAALRAELDKLTEEDFQRLRDAYPYNMTWFPHLRTSSGTSMTDAVIEALREIPLKEDVIIPTLISLVQDLLKKKPDDKPEDQVAPMGEEASQPGCSKHSVPWANGAAEAKVAAVSITDEASQPACSQRNIPGSEVQDFPDDTPTDEEMCDVESHPGPSNENPADVFAMECEESDSSLAEAQKIYESAAKEISELSKCVSDINSRYVTSRTLQRKCLGMRIEMEKFIMRQTDEESERAGMRNSLRTALAVNCPLFEWIQNIGEIAPDERTRKDSEKKSTTPARRSSGSTSKDDKLQNVERNRSVKKTRKNSQKRKIAVNLRSADESPEYRMLQNLWSTLDENSQSDIERMKEHLENTYEERLKYYCGSLPKFFFHEAILCKEAELRFGSEISVMEEKIADAVRAFSENVLFPRVSSTIPQRQLTVLEFCRFLEEGDFPQLITERKQEKPREPMQEGGATGGDGSPNIIAWPSEYEIHISSPTGAISLTDVRIERVLVYCLALYYMMDLAYPRAYQRVLYVLQRLLLPNDSPPDMPVTENMQSFLDFLERHLRGKKEPQ
ncbi:uncharacterized protein [Dermacentor albipictus]|uniref:uncharacterized protein n=1 Tax=Dermacentor albipictus TaxID=60249 RepID=UPI0031FD33FF